MSNAEETMGIFLETERLILRRFTSADVDNLVALDGDPDVMRFISGGRPTPRELIQDRILPMFFDSYERYPGYGFWAAIEKSSGEFLGWFSLRPREDGDPDDLGLGYRLRRAAWGKGYATEGARALIRKAFAELGARRVFAITYGENLRSRRVMERAGMRLVRTFRFTPEELEAEDTYDASLEDQWEGDDVEYALERAEWKQQEAAGNAHCGYEPADLPGV